MEKKTENDSDNNQRQREVGEKERDNDSDNNERQTDEEVEPHRSTERVCANLWTKDVHTHKQTHIHTHTQIAHNHGVRRQREISSELTNDLKRYNNRRWEIETDANKPNLMGRKTDRQITTNKPFAAVFSELFFRGRAREMGLGATAAASTVGGRAGAAGAVKGNKCKLSICLRMKFCTEAPQAQTHFTHSHIRAVN